MYHQGQNSFTEELSVSAFIDLLHQLHTCAIERLYFIFHLVQRSHLQLHMRQSITIELQSFHHLRELSLSYLFHFVLNFTEIELQRLVLHLKVLEKEVLLFELD